jgi:hypothetical protein
MSPSAVRSRRRRAKKRDGIRYFGEWLDEERLAAALRANDRLERGASPTEVAAALWLMVADYIERWT